MKIPIKPTTLAYAYSAYGYTVPAERTGGAEDVRPRGDGDLMDSIASLTLWEYLSAQRIPASVELTSNFGDLSDLVVFMPGREILIDIKSTDRRTFETPEANENPCLSVEWGKLPVKYEELGIPRIFYDEDPTTKRKTWRIPPNLQPRDIVTRADRTFSVDRGGQDYKRLADIFLKVFVYAEAPEPHIQVCGWVASRSDEYKAAVAHLQTCIQQGHFADAWIPNLGKVEDARQPNPVGPYRKVPVGYPGLWMPPAGTFEQLVEHLRQNIPPQGQKQRKPTVRGRLPEQFG